MELIAAAAFGLEGIVKRELQQMGIEGKAEQGGVRFSGGWEEAFRANMWLRCADRVLILITEKEIHTFEELFQMVRSVCWEEFLPRDARIHVTGKCVKSTLMSVSDCQSVSKKAIVERMTRVYRMTRLPESGTEYRIDIALHSDNCRITVDTSGDALNKRGYRTWNGEAPLRETLAAALIMLSPWYQSMERGSIQGEKFADGMDLHDPCCGTGTLLIEAALMMAERAPGLKRRFAMEDWPTVDKEMIGRLRKEANDRYDPERISGISGSDIDPEALKLCKKHIVQAGLGGRITVFQKDLLDLSPDICAENTSTSQIPFKNPVCFICNPPYGERMSDRKNCEKLYRRMKDMRGRFQKSRMCVITAYIGFEKCTGMHAQKRRRLYNGRLECDYMIF